MRIVVLVILWWLALPASATSTCDSSNVFDDRNGNGLRDPGEPGLAGVRVSDGVHIVSSAADGHYDLPPEPGRTIFVIKPAGYAFAMRADGLPDFWRHLQQPEPRPQLKYGGIHVSDAMSCQDLGLQRQRLPPRRIKDGLQVVLFADPQPKSLVDVGYYARDIVASVKHHSALPVERGSGSAPPYLQGSAGDLGMSLGDIVSDDLSLYPAINQVTASLGVPWLHVAGNHDIDQDAARDEDSLLTFRNTFGPDTFAWEEPEASFIALDDVVFRPGRKPAYVGGLREDQFSFLKAYLPTLPKHRLLVIGVHIPLFDTAAPGKEPTFRIGDRERLFALLRDFPHVLLLSAHTHNQRHVFHDAADGWHGAQPLHEYNVGAASGAFWSGVKDADGIPDTTMSDGTPNGYATLIVKHGGDYALAWHPARDAGDTQIGLHAPRVLRQGAYPAWGVYANVTMGMDGSRVEYRIDGGDWRPMAKVLQPDPRLRAENMRDDEAVALRGYDRSPEATPSTHLWRGALPTDLAAGTHRVDVRAFDRWRGELRASTEYRLASAAP